MKLDPKEIEKRWKEFNEKNFNKFPKYSARKKAFLRTLPRGKVFSRERLFKYCRKKQLVAPPEWLYNKGVECNWLKNNGQSFSHLGGFATCYNSAYMEEQCYKKMNRRPRRSRGRMNLEDRRKKRKINKILGMYKTWTEALNSFGSSEERLNILKEQAQAKHVYNKDYLLFRNFPIPLSSKKCIVCGGRAYCEHHVVPLACGGTNSASNTVPVCLACHKEIHPFMKTTIEENGDFDYNNIDQDFLFGDQLW